MAVLHGSVGLHGRNRHPDVAQVQRALRSAGHAPGPIDGLCGRLTIGAIVGLQRRFLPRPDGLVEVAGPTWRRLSATGRAAPAPASGPTRTVPPRNGPPPPGAAWPVAPPVTAPVAALPTGLALRYTDHLPLPARGTVNRGLRAASNRVMTDRLGLPRDAFTQDCLPPTNQAFKRMIVTADAGPFRVTGLRPAVASLATIFAEVRREHPDLHRRLGTAGMMCCRHQRGSSRAISNHAWGTAIDMTVGGVLVPRKAQYVILGLQLLAPIFNRHGWYWGAAFGTPDPHHFECGAALLETFDA
jgi:peptidoglycan hydrolase-like protein with peptidoglycan-binding domain